MNTVVAFFVPPNGSCSKSRKTNSQSEKITKWTKFQTGQNPELNKIPNRSKSRFGQNPEWTKSQIGQNPEQKKSRTDKIPN